MPQGPPPTHPHVRPILIVDDVTSEALTLRLLCQSLGVGAVTTASPTGIMTNLVMPGADAPDCLFMIAGHAHTVPVMGATASGKRLLKAASERAAAYAPAGLVCVAKPVDVPTLQAFAARTGLPSRPPRTALH